MRALARLRVRCASLNGLKPALQTAFQTASQNDGSALFACGHYFLNRYMFRPGRGKPCPDNGPFQQPFKEGFRGGFYGKKQQGFPSPCQGKEFSDQKNHFSDRGNLSPDKEEEFSIQKKDSSGKVKEKTGHEIHPPCPDEKQRRFKKKRRCWKLAGVRGAG